MDKDKKSPRVVVEEVTSEPSLVPEQPKPEPEIKVQPAVSFLWVIIPGIILLGLLMGGIIAYSSGMQKLGPGDKIPTPKGTPSATIIATPSASPKAKIDLAKFKIKVLNGSGIKGEAGKAKDLLEKADFVVETTGNAKTYDYQKTIIQAKTNVEENFLAALKESLSKTYELGKNETLKDTEPYSVIVVIGSSKAE